MTNELEVVNETSMSNSFVGDTVQICVVTHDLYRTLSNFVVIGIGPWKIYTFDEKNISDLNYLGQPNASSIKLAIAWSGSTMWEVIQPISGDSVYRDWLNTRGEGVHHVAQSCNGMSFDAKIAEFKSRGFKVTQSGVFQHVVPFAYINTEDSIGLAIELINMPAGYSMPEPEEWYPFSPAR